MISLPSPAVSGKPTRTYQTTGRAIAAARRRGQRVRCRILGSCGVYLACPDGRTIPQCSFPDGYVPIAADAKLQGWQLKAKGQMKGVLRK